MELFYIDPQSYNNLADYDKYLLENICSEVIFFCSDKFPYCEIFETNIYPLYYYNNFKGIKKIASYIKSQLKLLKIIKKEKPDIVHFQWFKIPIVDLFVLKNIRRCLKNTRIVFTAHNILPHDSGRTYVKVYKKIYDVVDKIIVHAVATKSELSIKFQISENKVAFIPHGFLPLKIRTSRIERHGKLIFSFIGFLSNYKGLDILLDAWCGTPELLENSKIQLIIAGAGNLPCLARIPKDKNIRLENYFHSESELAQIIADTDVAVLPYRSISQSGVLLTYLAEHVPVIVSNIGGLTQPFEVGAVGWILKELTAKELGNVIKDILRQPELIFRIKNDVSLWKQIESFYDWKNIGKATFELYKKISSY